MIIVDGEAVGSGVPPKGGIPPRREREKKMVVSPAVARSLKQAAEAPEPESAELTDTEKEADKQAASAFGPSAAFGATAVYPDAEIRGTAEIEVESEAPKEKGELQRPKDYESKPIWIDYAISKGADRDEAEGHTKEQLIQNFG